MKKSIKVLLLGILSFMIFIPNISAKTLQDLYNELAALEKSYSESQNKKNLTQGQINSLNGEINNIYNQITNTQNEILAASNKITESEKEIEDKKEETNQLLKYLQVSSGENVYLEYLFEADDYTDFIYRYSIIKQLSEYNNKVSEELKTLISNLENSKVELAQKKKDLESYKTTLISKRSTYESNLKNISSEGTTIKEDIADLKVDIKYYENAGCKKSDNLATCAGVPYASGWKYPLNYGVVTSNYGWRTYYINGGNKTDFHSGIDIGGNSEGTNVYAAAAGTIARIVEKSSCGGNMVYIYHNVKGGSYTTVYMHLLSIKVSKGQVVSDTTVIGTVGGGPKTYAWETCSTGAHLHFGMATGHNAYSFNSYMFDPDTIFSKINYVGASFNYR